MLHIGHYGLDIKPPEAIGTARIPINRLEIGPAVVEVNNTTKMSPIEFKVAVLGAVGLTVADIAQLTYHGDSTVRTHRSKGYRKLNARSISQLTAGLFDTGAFDPLTPLQSADFALTDRETRILDFVSQGLTKRAAGSALGVTEATIKTQLEHMGRKHDIHNLPSAVFLAHLSGQSGTTSQQV